MFILHSLLWLTLWATPASMFKVLLSPSVAGSVANISVAAVLQGGTYVGDAAWSQWTYITLSYSAYALQLNANDPSQFFAEPPLDVWRIRFLTQDKAKQTITAKFQGTPVISGPTAFNFTITNVQLPDNCEPLEPLGLSVTSGISNTVQFEASSTSISVLSGCQAPPVITSTVSKAITWREDGGPLDLSFAVITVTDMTPDPLPLQVILACQNGTLSMSSNTSGVVMSTSERQITITGMQGSVNEALGNLLYTPDAYFGSVDTITILADDMDHRGPGPQGRAKYSLLINVTAIPSPPSIALDLRTPYIQAGWHLPTDAPIQVTANDPVKPNTTFVVQIQCSQGTIMFTTSHFSPTRPVSSFAPTAGTYGTHHLLTGPLGDINQALATLVFKSELYISCSKVELGELSITAQQMKAGSPLATLAIPVYIVSDGATDGCGQDTVDWADFTPSSVLMGQDVTLKLRGYKVWPMVNENLMVALSKTDPCYLRNFSTLPVRAFREHENLQVTLPAREVGNWTVCYWTRQAGATGISETQPMAMARKLRVYSSSAVQKDAFLGGFMTCQNFLRHINTFNSSLGVCGCKFMDNSTTADTVPLGIITMSTTYPADYLLYSDAQVAVNMGCCIHNAPRMTMMNINQNQSWGYCSLY